MKVGLKETLTLISKGYSKKESQQVAAHDTLNKIKKDAAFVESIFAAKSLKENTGESLSVSEPFKEETIQEVREEVAQRVDKQEEIISAAEDAAYSEMEK